LGLKAWGLGLGAWGLELGIVVHYIALQYIYITLHYITSHYNTLHLITFIGTRSMDKEHQQLNQNEKRSTKTPRHRTPKEESPTKKPRRRISHEETTTEAPRQRNTETRNQTTRRDKQGSESKWTRKNNPMKKRAPTPHFPRKRRSEIRIKGVDFEQIFVEIEMEITKAAFDFAEFFW